MVREQPDPISTAERARRLRRVRRIALRLGFLGRVDYRHVFNGGGGAQFGLGSSPAHDLLVVYAEAFVRDADPDDFSLEALIAHERGHQIVCRHCSLQKVLVKAAPIAEEILASLAGSLIVEDREDRQSLTLKALADATGCGLKATEAVKLVCELRSFLEET